MPIALPRRVAIVGANRIPFARSNTAYAQLSNKTMLTDTLRGLVEKHHLQGELLGEVVGGAVMKHARDWNMVRECVLSSGLKANTPAFDVQQACGTGLEAAILVANKIALGQIDAGIACGVDTTSDAPVAVNRGLQRALMDLNAAKTTSAKLKHLMRAINPKHLVPELPANAEPRTGCFGLLNNELFFDKAAPKNIITTNTQQKIKIGPNDICYCGSNKKYKKCCGKK